MLSTMKTKFEALTLGGKLKQSLVDNNKTNTSAAAASQYGSGLVGLSNLGNTCFMNSILQCLLKTKLLREYFGKKQYQQQLNEDCAPTKGKLAKAFSQLMLDIWSKREASYITPTVLKSEVQKYAVRFSGYHQQDAQEFLRFFIEGVHDDLNAIRGRKPVYTSSTTSTKTTTTTTKTTTTTTTTANADDDNDDKARVDDDDESTMTDCEKSELYWQRYLSREKSLIQDLFVGQLKSTLTCTHCEHRSVTYDPFWDLSLPIPNSTPTTRTEHITHCFRAFTQEEILDGDEQPTCEKCKKRRKCTKRFLLEKFPKVLVIHLKRFSGTRYRTKLDTKITFPTELCLTEFSANSDGQTHNPVYSLYGVSNHMGGTHGGHYTAYCKHPDTDRWHVYNDSRVREMSANKVCSSSAYVLFYELKSNDCSTTTIA